MSTVATLGVDDVATHAVMLLDHRRVDLYAEALAAQVQPGDVVADIGAGSGILAALAARAGARRVFAVERGPVAHLARKILMASGLDGIVEVLRGDAREVALPEPPTMLISETLGNFGIDEDTLSLFALLTRRCAPEVRTIPQRVEPMMALLSDSALSSELATLTSLRGLDLRLLRASLVHRVLPCRLDPSILASAPVPAGSFRVGLDVSPRTLTTTLRASQQGEVNALGGWFRAYLTDTILLDTGPLNPPTHWSHLLFPIDPPIFCEEGDVVEVALTPRYLPSLHLWTWQVRLGSELRQGDAFSALLGDARDIAAQISSGGLPPAVQTRLEALRIAFQGPAVAPAEMGRRLFAAYPDRYASEADAEQEIWALLRAYASLR
ncbi:MAG: 50S ribosomal protein L11 methyltransferase [Myxococcales bacterium]|nr:50S ribosomal protein L11 methyltransferase [Polyangiaceae bacterium]MDW8250022.1 50S ribosomal protein L11 methyltransferase [Myxococcales bacterium]